MESECRRCWCGVSTRITCVVSERTTAVVLFLLLCGVYHLNGDGLPGNDAKPNVYLPVSVLTEGDLSFSPSEAPFMFTWRLDTPRGVRRVVLADWEQSIDGTPARALYARGELTVGEGRYFIAPTIHTDPETGEPLYVSLFGPGPGLVALPAFAVLHVIVDDLPNRPAALWYGAKAVASVLVAGSGVLVFLIGQRFTNRRWAVLLALAYGLGTCVWSVSSQALWQHGPNEFFLALGTYLFIRIRDKRSHAAWCAVAYALAVVCRPTSAIVVLVIGVYLLLTNRKALVWYVLAGLPVAVALGAYNHHYFGSPFEFGQISHAADVAEYKTGSSAVWQTPLLEGAAGLLFSPSRGLLVYSPVVVFAFWGAVRVWREDAYAVFRPLTVAVLVMWGVAFKHFDWWGGWSFGYRHIVDTMPMVVLLMIPALKLITRRKWAMTAFVGMMLWSVLVQVTGAFAYNLTGWNAKAAGYRLRVPGQTAVAIVPDLASAKRLVETRGGVVLGEELMDVDLHAYRHRLWSVRDSQILYYLTNFTESRRLKREAVKEWIENPAS